MSDKNVSEFVGGLGYRNIDESRQVAPDVKGKDVGWWPRPSAECHRVGFAVPMPSQLVVGRVAHGSAQ